MSVNDKISKYNSRMACGRKRSLRNSGFVVASAVALSFTCAAAFQSSFTARRSCQHGKESTTKLSVVTDPRKLLQMEYDERERPDIKALEDLYLLSTLADGLSGEMVEELPHAVLSNKTKKIRKAPTEVRKATRVAGETAQFKGLSLSPSSRGKKGNTLSKVAPEAKSIAIERQQSAVPNRRSSTMPGYLENSSDRQKAFKDGIKLAEQRSGRKYVETPEAKKSRKQVNGENMYKTSASVPDSLVSFAKEIHGIERITPKDEVTLGKKTQEAIRLQKIYDGLVDKFDREPTDDEWCAASGRINMEAINEAIQDGLDAKDRLVTSNLRMVQGVVNVYIRNGLRGQYNAGDLMQEGILALIRAAEKFDPSRGFRFSTYAMYWIRAAIKRNQIYQSRVITVPQRLYENHKRVKRVQKELSASLGRPPTKKELAEAVGMSEMQLERCLEAMSQQCYSLDQEISNPLKPMKSDSSRGDTMYELVSARCDDPDDNEVKYSFLREDLIETLYRHLTKEEANLLLLRYGLTDTAPPISKSGPLTIAEVSRTVGLKPDKVRRMLDKSLKQLRAVIGDEWLDYEREFQ